MRKIVKDQGGQDLVEYALMISFVSVAALAIVPGMVTEVAEIFRRVTEALGGNPRESVLFSIGEGTVQIASAIVALIILCLIVLRRKHQDKMGSDY